MAAPAFLPQSQAFRSPPGSQQSGYPVGLSTSNPFDRDATARPVGTPFSTTPSPASPVLIRRLPIDTTEEKLRLMLLFSQELVDVEMLSPELSEDAGLRSAVVKFKTPTAAQQAKDSLHGKSMSNDVEMIVEILSGSPGSTRRYPVEMPSTTAPSVSSSLASNGPSSRQSSRFNGGFHSLEKISPPMNGIYATSELPNPDSSTHYSSLFSPQSPIGNHLTERARISGKSLISHDTADDDETRELLKDPVAYAESGPSQQRRATAPHLPIARLASLSLNTATNGAASLPAYGHPGVNQMPNHQNTMSPTAMTNNSATSAHPINYHLGGQHFQQRHNFPPVNPADQNPPCNTLYVGNLPIDTSEEELKAVFSKQRGYKRLCFRTKQNGPMCFVEFEDVSFATKALHELYGHPLHNSVKGGIRLSFSKNPLGVRSGQSPNQSNGGPMSNLTGISGPAGGFTTANGPPPGLAAPPGLNRLATYSSSGSVASPSGNPFPGGPFPGNNNNVWNNAPPYNGPMSAGGTPAAMNHAGSAFPPPYMMGR